eukprot:gene10059-biopygen19774
MFCRGNIVSKRAVSAARGLGGRCMPPGWADLRVGCGQPGMLPTKRPLPAVHRPPTAQRVEMLKAPQTRPRPLLVVLPCSSLCGRNTRPGRVQDSSVTPNHIVWGAPAAVPPSAGSSRGRTPLARTAGLGAGMACGRWRGAGPVTPQAFDTKSGHKQGINCLDHVEGYHFLVTGLGGRRARWAGEGHREFQSWITPANDVFSSFGPTARAIGPRGCCTTSVDSGVAAVSSSRSGGAGDVATRSARSQNAAAEAPDPPPDRVRPRAGGGGGVPFFPPVVTGGSKKPGNSGLRAAIRTAAHARSGPANDTDELRERGQRGQEVSTVISQAPDGARTTRYKIAAPQAPRDARAENTWCRALCGDRGNSAQAEIGIIVLRRRLEEFCSGGDRGTFAQARIDQKKYPARGGDGDGGRCRRRRRRGGAHRRRPDAE